MGFHVFSSSPLLNLRSSHCLSLPRVSGRGGGERVTVSCRKPDRSTHASKRGGRGSGEQEKCSVAVSVSPAMGRGAHGLFKRLMPLDDVKAAAVAQQEWDRMAGRPLVFF